MSKIGINGFGRIGRLVLRRLLEVGSDAQVVAINDLTSPKVLAYLLKHDSNYGPFRWSVDFTEDSLIVDGKKSPFMQKKRQNTFHGAAQALRSSWSVPVSIPPAKNHRRIWKQGRKSVDLCPGRRDENHRF